MSYKGDYNSQRLQGQREYVDILEKEVQEQKNKNQRLQKELDDITEMMQKESGAALVRWDGKFFAVRHVRWTFDPEYLHMIGGGVTLVAALRDFWRQMNKHK